MAWEYLGQPINFSVNPYIYIYIYLTSSVFIFFLNVKYTLVHHKSIDPPKKNEKAFILCAYIHKCGMKFILIIHLGHTLEQSDVLPTNFIGTWIAAFHISNFHFRCEWKRKWELLLKYSKPYSILVGHLNRVSNS